MALLDAVFASLQFEGERMKEAAELAKGLMLNLSPKQYRHYRAVCNRMDRFLKRSANEWKKFDKSRARTEGWDKPERILMLVDKHIEAMNKITSELHAIIRGYRATHQ
jgi:hypothetical protein